MSNYLRTRRALITRYNPETLALRDNIMANAGTISAASLLSADAFVTSCKLSGVWPKLIDCGLFIGDQLAAALVKLVSGSGQATLTNHGFVGGDYAEQGANGGLLGDGVGKYLNTGVASNTAQLASLAFYARAAAPNGVESSMVAAAPDGRNKCGLTHTAGGNDEFYNVDLNEAGRTGLYAGVTVSNTDERLYLNGVMIAENAACPGLPPAGADTFFVFAQNAGGGPAQFWTGRGSFYCIAKIFTPADMNNLYGAVQALQIALNRNV